MTPSLLATKDWIWIITVIAAASAANMAGMHQIQLSMIRDMKELDERWQVRVIEMKREIKEDFQEVKRNITPDWFKKMVDDLQVVTREHDKRLDELEAGVK